MSEQLTLTLLGGFSVYRDQQHLVLPPSCQRAVALAALKRRPVLRTWMYSTLWPYCPPSKATARLRATLWRLRPMGADALLQVDSQSVALAPGVAVDWYNAVDLIEQLTNHTEPAGGDPSLVAELLPLLRAGELLDGWTDHWNAHDRGRYHAMRTAALDVLTRSSDRGIHPHGPRPTCSPHFSNDSMEP